MNDPVTASLGFDSDDDALERWSRVTVDRHRALLVERRESVADLVESDSLWWEDLDDAGHHFLCFRTHILSYTSSPSVLGLHVADVRLALAMARCVSGRRVVIPLESLRIHHGTLLDGTNLFFDPTIAPRSTTIVLDGNAGTIALGGLTIPAIFGRDRVVLTRATGEWFTTLPYDGEFVSFFRESENEAGTRQTRHLIDEASLIADDMMMLANAKAILREHWPRAWALVRHVLLYVNWTDAPLRESSTTLSDCPGAILLNRRTAFLRSPSEQVAWLAHGLYHEAKHVQFFFTFRNGAGSEFSIEGMSRGLSPRTPSVPCAWRGVPTLRSMGAHLLSLQAFIPGLIVFLTEANATWTSCDWLRRRVEMDMRAVNGAMATLVLGRHALMPAGNALLDVLVRSYVEHLIPAYQHYHRVVIGGDR